MTDTSKVGKPISVKDLGKLHLNEKITQLTANILYNKAEVLKENLKKELDITQDQFETIMRKNPERFTTELLAGTESSIICERVYFEKKYLFTVSVVYINNISSVGDNQRSTSILYDVYKEASVEDLAALLNIDDETEALEIKKEV